MAVAQVQSKVEPQKLVRISEAAEFLSVSRSSVYGMMASGVLPFVKLGRSRRVRWADVFRLIERNTIGGEEA